MTNARSPGLGVRYAAALAEYLDVADEASLEHAYELGRDAMAQGLGVLDLASVHSKAMAQDLPRVDDDAARHSRRTWQFFAEALAPFEMALRGFREANVALKQATTTLEQRVEARTLELSAAERTLRQQATILNSVMESISDGIVVADTDGRYILFNHAGARILGTGPTDVPLSDRPAKYGLFRPDTTTPFPADQLPLARAISGEQTGVESVFVRNEANPEGIHVTVIGSPLRSEEGVIIGGVVVFRDVTDAHRASEQLRQTEEQLRQSQKMDAIGRLAGGVAHDFNNMLAVIDGYCGLLMDDLSPDSPMREDLDAIAKAAKRAGELTRQLLLFSRQQVVEPRVLDLNETIATSDKMLRRLLGADIDLVTLPAPGLGRVRADAGSLEQVVMNLAVNARDAMPTGGQLTIETGNVMLDEAYASEHHGAVPGPHVMVAVSDTGCGMDAATRQRIFEPFFTTKERGKGTGLGLSTVFGIVKQSGGTVWVYSEPGKGTTFKVYLPRIDAELDGTLTQAEPRTLRGTETVLLVDDDDQVRQVTRAILQRSGYHVLDARNANEALALSDGYGGQIQLLITDVVMPQMSGPELAKRLASRRPRLRVLCMSGYTDDSIVRHGVLGGEVPYLQKPATPYALTKRVREVLV